MTPKDWIWVTFLVAAAVVLVTWVISRHLGASRTVRAELTSGKQYRALADEYRRLSDLAITAQEHTDLRLAELGVQMEDLRSQIGQLRHILQEVE